LVPVPVVGFVSVCARNRSQPLSYYRNISVFLRLAALAALTVPLFFGPALMAQENADVQSPNARSSASALQPDESDPAVIHARANLDQVKHLASAGALPQIRVQKAEEDLQDALDESILKKSLYTTNLHPEHADQIVYVAQRMVVRRQKALMQLRELVAAGVISRAEADVSGANLARAQQDLEWAQNRARLVEQIAENVRREQAMATLENQAESHPEWAGKVFTKFQGSGVFTAAERKALEAAYFSHFAKPLPISADGETELHKSLGFDHRGRIDVAVTPDQPEGIWLTHYLEEKHIPFYAFRAAVPHQATGAHIHVGPGSTKLALSD
jgi:hypothetical protein